MPTTQTHPDAPTTEQYGFYLPRDTANALYAMGLADKARFDAEYSAAEIKMMNEGTQRGSFGAQA